MKVQIVGQGRVGCSFARVLSENGHAVRLTSAREPRVGKDWDLTILACRDQYVPTVASSIRETIGEAATVMHVSGALRADVLPLSSRAQAYPLHVFPDGGHPLSADELRGSFLWVSGSAVNEARGLGNALGMRVASLDGVDLELFHSGITLALCGDTHALKNFGLSMLLKSGVNAHHAQLALRALVKSAAKSGGEVCISSVRRRDVERVRRQCQLIQQEGGEVALAEFKRLARTHALADGASEDILTLLV